MLIQSLCELDYGVYHISKIVCSYQKRLIENRGSVNQILNTELSRISETWVGFLARNTTISKNACLKLWKITFQGCTMTAFHVLSPWKIFWKEHENFASFLLQKKPAYLNDQLQVAIWSAREQSCLQGKQAFFSPLSPSTPTPLLFFNTFVFK